MAKDFAPLDAAYANFGANITTLKAADAAVVSAKEDVAAKQAALDAAAENLGGAEGDYDSADAAAEVSLQALVDAAKGLDVTIPPEGAAE